MAAPHMFLVSTHMFQGTFAGAKEDVAFRDRHLGSEWSSYQFWNIVVYNG